MAPLVDNVPNQYLCVVFITISSVARIMITGFPDLYSQVNLNLTSKYSEI